MSLQTIALFFALSLIVILLMVNAALPADIASNFVEFGEMSALVHVE